MAATNRDKRRTGETDPRRGIGYVRVSSDDQRLGPEAQRAVLKQWCTAHGGQLVATCIDRGVSGGAALDQWPGLLAALAAVKKFAAGVLLVAKRDRLARDPWWRQWLNGSWKVPARVCAARTAWRRATAPRRC
jgi:DNA invertase Pin-like site-specific DNA recombinase